MLWTKQFCAILLANLSVSMCFAQTCEDLPEHRKLLEHGKELSRNSPAPVKSDGRRSREVQLPVERFGLYPGTFRPQPLLPVNEIDRLPLATTSDFEEAEQHALKYRESKDYSSAEKIYRRILSAPQIEKHLQSKASVYEWLGQTQMEHADTDKNSSLSRSAMASFQEAIKIRLALIAEDKSKSDGERSNANLSLCNDYRRLAVLQESQRDPEKAYSSLHKALTACGSYQLCRAEIADALIELSMRNGRLKELHEVESVLTDKEFKQNYTRSGNVGVYERLEAAYVSFGKNVDAERVMTMLFDGYSCCTDLRRDLNTALKYAQFLEHKGKYDKSAELYSKLIAKIEGQKYEISKNVTMQVISAMSKPDAAQHYKSLIEKAQAILTWQQDRAQRFECLQTAAELDQTASRLLSQSELDTAEKLYKRSLDIKIKNLDPDDPEIASAYFQLARVADEKKQFDIAIVNYQQALSIYRKNPKDDPRQQALVLENFAGLLDRLHRTKEAENTYAEARAAYALAKGHLNAPLIRGRGSTH
jgi:tetratricopeptide (TPR) repeat protein